MPRISDLFGQEAAVAALRRALSSDCLPGCYLFVGTAGVGKGALARAVAQAATCLNPTSEPFDSCGICGSCRLAAAGTHPEIVTFWPSGEATQIWQFWERDNKANSGALSKTLLYAPSIGKRRIYITERTETLTESAANSLLKVLEEPPPYALFILLAPHPARVLPTIVSRSQMVRLNAAPRADLERYLVDNVGILPGPAAMLASYSEGRTGLAVRMAQTPAVGEEIARVLDFAETIPEAPGVRALKLAEQMRKLAVHIKALIGEETTGDDGGDGEVSGKEKTSRRQLAAVFDLLIAFYRDLMAFSVGGGAARQVINQDRSTTLYALAAQSDTGRWIRCLEAIMIARRRLDANGNVALVTEVLAMSLVSR